MTNPLNASFTVPGIGLVISIRSLLQTLCVAADLDKDICDLITKKPEQACKALVAKGDKWLKSKIEEAFNEMISKVLENVDCQKKGWQEIVAESISISFSSEGIAVDVDTAAIVQNVVCAIARRTIGMALDAPISMAVRKLKEACSKLTPASAKESSSQALTKTKKDTELQRGLRLFRQRDPAMKGLGMALLIKRNAEIVKLAEAAAARKAQAKAKPPAKTKPPAAPVPSSKWLWWVVGGVGVAGLGAWALARRR